MTPRSLSNWLLVICLVQIMQFMAVGWLAIEVASIRHDLDLQTNQ